MKSHKVSGEDGMSFRRRQFLKILSYAFGSSFIQNKLAMAAQNSAQPASCVPPAKTATKPELGGTDMEKVAGIGGLFFRAHDPAALGNWYHQHLGIALTPTSEGGTVAARGRPDGFQSLSRKEWLFRGS